MKIRRMERYLLLRDSGELSARRRKQLEAAIAADRDLQMEAKGISELRTLWKEVSADSPSPADAVVGRIRREITAATFGSFRKTAVVFHFRLPAIAPAYAAAAAMILAVGLFVAGLLEFRAPRPDGEELDMRIAETLDDINGSLLTLLDSLAERGNPPEVEWDALALQLMLMEDS